MAILDSVLSAGWPVSNLLAISSRAPEPASPDGADAKFAGQPVAPLSTHLAVQAGGLPRLILALACWSALPGADVLATLSWSWVAPIVLRDLAVTLCVAGFWDAAIYSSLSPWASRTAALKFNPAKPRDAQFAHDMFWSLVSTLVSAAAEVALLHAWARGALPAALAPAALPAVWWRHGPTLFWVLSMPYFRILHFFCIHRAMHAGLVVPLLGWDVGAFLYKHVHSLHHKSRNPTAWSGVSMHPVESSAYYSAMLIPALLGAHPMIFLFYKFDLTIAALIGHDGHGAPATGSHDHWSVRTRARAPIAQPPHPLQHIASAAHSASPHSLNAPLSAPLLNNRLHHHKVNCNYGESYVPLDWIFGSYAGSEADFEAKFGGDSGKKKTA
jgi:sterol desaturase/sphingolipid hydroxylase (fatty acid hydroxylase superfamily)